MGQAASTCHLNWTAVGDNLKDDSHHQGMPEQLHGATDARAPRSWTRHCECGGCMYFVNESIVSMCRCDSPCVPWTWSVFSMFSQLLMCAITDASAVMTTRWNSRATIRSAFRWSLAGPGTRNTPVYMVVEWVAEWIALVFERHGFESRWSRSLHNDCGQVVHTYCF